MRKRFIYLLLILIFQLVSCEAFFTTSWFQGAADYSNISVSEALSSGDPAIMQEVLDQVIVDAASASGDQAADLYMQAADLTLGISGMSDPTVLLSAASLFDSGGDTASLFSILTDTGVDLTTLSNVDDLLESAETESPGSVPADKWLFASAGASAEIALAAEAAGQDVDTYLSSNPGPDALDNATLQNSVQYLINSIPDFNDGEVSPLEQMLIDNRADLESYPGITFP